LWTFVYEPSSFSVRRYELAPPGWPRELDGLEVALLADIHVGSPYRGLDKLREIVRETNAAAPDLVVFADDYVIDSVLGGTFVAPEELAPILGELGAPLGVYAVLGNHDWWLDGDRVEEALVAAGIRVLRDEAVGLSGVWLVGLGDWEEAPPDVRKALSAVDDTSPVLVFTHNPDVFPTVPARVSLTLAGHTHGGQVRFPWLGTPIVPSRYGQRYAHGHIVEDDRHLFVTSGLGTSIIPVRFAVPPEIALLRLSADVANAPPVSSRIFGP
jgi:predicted MPP superfamily phosphohydrolase